MPLESLGRARLLAHHLYDLAVCEHKVALDARLDRAWRTPPDEALALLLERGNRFEAEVADCVARRSGLQNPLSTIVSASATYMSLALKPAEKLQAGAVARLSGSSATSIPFGCIPGNSRASREQSLQ